MCFWRCIVFWFIYYIISDCLSSGYNTLYIQKIKVLMYSSKNVIFEVDSFQLDIVYFKKNCPVSKSQFHCCYIFCGKYSVYDGTLIHSYIESFKPATAGIIKAFTIELRKCSIWCQICKNELCELLLSRSRERILSHRGPTECPSSERYFCGQTNTQC